MQKLYVIVRADLRPGQQAVQGMHAAIQFLHDFPTEEKKWFEESNHVVFLESKNEESLQILFEELVSNGENVSYFREPDYKHELTAIATVQSSSSFFSSLKLALKNM